MSTAVDIPFSPVSRTATELQPKAATQLFRVAPLPREELLTHWVEKRYYSTGVGLLR